MNIAFQRNFIFYKRYKQIFISVTILYNIITITEKKGSAEISKNLTRYRSKNNFIRFIKSK